MKNFGSILAFLAASAVLVSSRVVPQAYNASLSGGHSNGSHIEARTEEVEVPKNWTSGPFKKGEDHKDHKKPTNMTSKGYGKKHDGRADLTSRDANADSESVAIAEHLSGINLARGLEARMGKNYNETSKAEKQAAKQAKKEAKEAAKEEKKAAEEE